MARDDWKIVRLEKAHRRDIFDCGSDDLNEYIRRFARQNDRKGIGRVYVAVYPDEVLVRGYYTLSNSAVERESMPEEERKKLPRYPVPTVLIGRLAVDNSAQGLGLGRGSAPLPQGSVDGPERGKWPLANPHFGHTLLAADI